MTTTESQSPLVSIVVNNFNYARFLGKAIDSALAQTYEHVEVIVVDDGSTDESRNIIAAYGKRVVPVLKSNGGQASAFNAGYETSRGLIVLFLDADDVLSPDVIEKVVPLFVDRTVKVHWALLEIDDAGKLTGNSHPRQPMGEGDLRARCIERGPVTANSPPTSGNAWSREFLKKVFPIPETSFRINADGYLLSLAWIYGTVTIARNATGYYRVHGKNHFGSKTEKERRELQLDKFPHQCTALQSHLMMQGVVGSFIHMWNAYQGVKDPGFDEKSKEHLAEVIPSGARIVLADDNAWPDFDAGANRVVHFLERDGVYWGRPESDEAALSELKQLEGKGIEFLVLPWFTRWYLDSYPMFAAHVLSKYRIAVDDDMILVFDMCNAPLSAYSRN
jgi:glycosyltransferase involved in cell wall biosynthesis